MGRSQGKGKGWELDFDALKQWIFDNWAFLEGTMQRRLTLGEDVPLLVVKLDGVFNLNTGRFSWPSLQLYTNAVEYAVFGVHENSELTYLVKNRIVGNRYALQFTRYELAGLFEPNARRNSSS